MSAMLCAKLAVMVLGVGGSAVGMLALRQSRLQAAHEAAEARLRMRTHAERTMDLRAEVARRVTPEALARYAEDPSFVPAIESRLLPDHPTVDPRESGAPGAPGTTWGASP